MQDECPINFKHISEALDHVEIHGEVTQLEI